jgi:hypothetical protein
MLINKRRKPWNNKKKTHRNLGKVHKLKKTKIQQGITEAREESMQKPNKPEN